MHRRESPWRWPGAVALAAILLLGGVLGTPRSWLAFLLPAPAHDGAAAAAGRRWLVLSPPPEVLVVPDVPPSAPPTPTPRSEPPEPAWWDAAWNIRVTAAAEEILAPPPPAAADSSRALMAALGLGEDWLTAVRPDSVLASRLLLLERTSGYLPADVRPYLNALGRHEAYRDIISRATAMYDEFLLHEISVPD